jgi:hypothetical protein
VSLETGFEEWLGRFSTHWDHIEGYLRASFRKPHLQGAGKTQQLALGYSDEQAMRLIESLPEFSQELTSLLSKAGASGLAAQVDHLEIVARCSCDDAFCASFYTAPKPRGSYGPKHRNIALEPDDGMIILDLVDEVIVNVEVIDRPDVRSRLALLSP